MMPAAYRWLEREPGPRMLKIALALHGIREAPGAADNPVIMDWAREVGCTWYGQDAIPWCGLFVAVCAKRAGWDLPPIPLRARSWIGWGAPSPAPALGDVLVFERGAAGHVGLYVGESVGHYHVLGGNQGDAVCIVRLPKWRMIACRQAPWLVAKPENVRPIPLGERLADGGWAPVSIREA